MTKIIASLLFATLIPAAALADSTTTETIAPPSCKKPLLPSSVRKADDSTEFDERMDEYKACITAYVDQQTALSKAHVDAANSAITDSNAFFKTVNESRSKVGG